MTRDTAPGWLFAALLPALVADAVYAAEPLYVRNMSPLAGLLGFPSQRSAATQPRGDWTVALHGSLASHYVVDREGSEVLRFDGETGRLALELRYGLAERWDLQLELPWLRHSGGNLDSLIDSWHDLWGMTDGGRSNSPNDLLEYRYADPALQFALDDDTSGLGDASLSLSYALTRGEGIASSLALGYKFASGEEEDFLGSGAADAWLALRFSSGSIGSVPLGWHARAGYLRAGSSDLMGDRQERDLWFAGAALDWMFASRWSLLLQLDSHAAPLDSQLTALGDPAVMLALGVRWRFAPAWQVDFSFIEDAMVETAPDVTFQASVRYRPGE